MKCLGLFLIGMLAASGIHHSVAEDTPTSKTSNTIVSVKMEPAAMTKQVQEMKMLLVSLTLFAGDNGGKYPGYLNELRGDFLEETVVNTVMGWNLGKKTSLPIYYIAGFTDSNRGSTVMIASPCVVNGKRVLGFLDGSVKEYPAEEGEKLLRESMNRQKDTALRTTLEKAEMKSLGFTSICLAVSILLVSSCTKSKKKGNIEKLQTEMAYFKAVVQMRALHAALASYARNHTGSFPTSLEEAIPPGLSEPGHRALFRQTKDKQQIHPIYYITGLTEVYEWNTPIVASPVPPNREHAVGFLDGSAEIVSEEEWTTLLNKALKDPKLALKTTLVGPPKQPAEATRPTAMNKGSVERASLMGKTKQIQSLLTYLALYSGDHAGHYPNTLGKLEDIPEENRKSLLYWQPPKGEAIPIHYISGLTDSHKGNTPIVAGPVSSAGKRAVGFLDGSAMIISDDEYRTLLESTLKDPELTLRTTLEGPSPQPIEKR